MTKKMTKMTKMMKRILIPVDGSPAAEAILPQLDRLLRGKESEWTFLRVVPPVPALPGIDHARLAGTDRSQSEKYLGDLVKRLEGDGVRARGLTVDGHEAETILRVAREVKATMIAMTTHGRTGVSRWTLGSVAEKVVRASEVPVLLLRSFEGAVPRPPRELAVRRILFPVDGSDLAAAALPAVEEIARGFGSEVLALHVQPEPDLFVFGRAGVDPVQVTPPEPESVTAPILERLKGAGIRAVGREARGDAASRILDAAQSESVDLIVISTHGRTGVSRWVLGSVTEKVLRGSTVPMLVVRTRPAQARRAPRRKAELAGSTVERA